MVSASAATHGRGLGGGGVQPGSPVPKGFVATSLSWPSKTSGWILGNAPCSKAGRGLKAARRAPSAPPPTECTYTVGTRNGGKTWTYDGKVNAQISRYAGGEPIVGVTDIRSFNDKVGWVIGSDFFHTTDGGHVWTREAIPGGGKQVLSLASTTTASFAIVSGCAWGNSCPAPLSLWRNVKATGTTWTRVSLTLPSNPNAQVVAAGTTVYVSDPLESYSGKKDRLYASTNGGAKFTSRAVPCAKGGGHSGIVSVAATSSEHMALLCESDAGLSDSLKTAYVSNNAGKSYTNAGNLPASGISAELALSSTGDLVAATWSAGSFLDVNDSHHTKWVEVAGDPDPGWNDLGFVSSNEAWVVYAGADTGADVGELFVTHDDGLHWSQVGY